MRNLRLLFIVGIGRSGTSLVQSMLAAHPQIYCLPETGFLRRILYRHKLDTALRRRGVSAAAELLAEDNYFRRTGLDASEIVHRSVAIKGSLDHAVYINMLDSFRHDSHYWIGDKDPRAIEFLPLLKAVAPNITLIHVYRDPRDVLASKKHAAWSRKGHVWKHIFANRVQFMIARKHGPRLFGQRYLELRYEDLLSKPEATLSGLCTLLQIDYDEKMLSFGNAARRLVAKDELDWKSETFGPLLRHNTSKWLKNLTSKEIVLTQNACRQTMEHGKFPVYQPQHPLYLLDRLWIAVARLLIVGATRPYILFREWRVRHACKTLR